MSYLKKRGFIYKFCQYCNETTKIIREVEMDEINCKISVPYCDKCENELLEYEEDFNDFFEKNFLKLGDETKFYNIESIISSDNKEYAFEPNKPIYSYQDIKYVCIIGLIIAFIWLILCLAVYSMDSGLSNDNGGLIFLTFMLIPSYIQIIVVIYNCIKKNKLEKMFTYIKENGKVFRGKVKSVLKNETRSEDSNGDTRYSIEYYLEIEYINPHENFRYTIITPALRKLPCKSDITCDVYTVDKLPEKYKKFKYARKTIADNFI